MTCCTEDHKCSFGQGDCDFDAECQSALVCGNDNCGSDFPDSSYDCCDCNCNTYGSNGCNDNGICNCKTNFDGINCNKCADGYYNFPACEACNCNSQGSIDVLCNDKGVCNCKANVVGSKCMECAAGYFPFPTCNEECNCNEEGSNGVACDNNGVCNCKAKFTNDKCDECNFGYFPFPECDTVMRYIVATGNPSEIGVKTEVVDLSDPSKSCLLEDISYRMWSAGGMLGTIPVICGGDTNNIDNRYLDECLLYGTNHVVSMNSKRYFHSSVALSDGRIWIMGGYWNSRLDSTEIYPIPCHNSDKQQTYQEYHGQGYDFP